MSNLHSDFQSSQLMPQNFKNSDQAPITQSPNNQQTFQGAQSSQLLQNSIVAGPLRVDIGNGRAVLGQSTVQSRTVYSSEQSPQQTSWGLVYSLSVISFLGAVLFYYFLKKYRNLKQYK